jgi:phospholipase/lecithinase/hemolysin
MQAVQCRLDIAIYNGIMQEVSRERKVPLIDTQAQFNENDDAKLFATPIHPGAAGHKIIAEAAYEVLLRRDLTPRAD